VWQRFCDRFLKRPLMTISRSFMIVARVCCEGCRLFWRPIKLICLYLLFCLFSGTIHRTFLTHHVVPAELQTANVAHFRRKIQLSRWLAVQINPRVLLCNSCIVDLLGNKPFKTQW
jgi:hypothetical protein